MSDIGYPIILSNGTTLGGSVYEVLDVSQVANSIADSSLTSLNLLRRGSRHYAEVVSESLVHILESFANNAGPSHPLVGQLWYDTSNRTLKVWNGTTFGLVADGAATGLANPVNIELRDTSSNLSLGAASFNGTDDVVIPFSFPATGVVAGTYAAPTIGIDATGRITSVTPAVSANTAAIVEAIGYSPADDTKVVHKTGDTMTGSLNVTDADVNPTGLGRIKQGGFELIPRGVIVMWSGSTAPDGWNLCDGTNGTPDLRGRFIVSIGAAIGDPTQIVYSLGTKGGVNLMSVNTDSKGDHTHVMTAAVAGSHSHGGATEGFALGVTHMPPHAHGMNWGVDSVNNSAAKYGTHDPLSFTNIGSNANALTFTNAEWLTENIGGGVPHAHTIDVEAAHTHVITAATAGAHTHAVSFDNRPLFYALAYIMKL